MQMDTSVEAVLPLAVKALDQLIMEISVKADNLPGWRHKASDQATVRRGTVRPRQASPRTDSRRPMTPRKMLLLPYHAEWQPGQAEIAAEGRRGP
jgi:hypothetical protein